LRRCIFWLKREGKELACFAFFDPSRDPVFYARDKGFAIIVRVIVQLFAVILE
jgi:hypothetical protein